MGQMAVRRTLAFVLPVVLTLGGACSGDDDDTGASTDTLVTTTLSPAVATPGTTPADTDSTGAVTSSDSSSTGASATDAFSTQAASTPAPTVAVVDTGVPGLTSDDAFCAAWSRFGGSWQLLVQAAAAGDPAEVARLEVIASTVVQDAYKDVFAVWPAQLESERAVAADAYFGAFQRRSADAAAALSAAGASAADVAVLAQAWDAALAQYDPSTTVEVAVPPDLEPIVGQAAAAFGEQRVPLQADPSMVITAETPSTDEFLATACPDRGWIVGQDVVADSA